MIDSTAPTSFSSTVFGCLGVSNDMLVVHRQDDIDGHREGRLEKLPIAYQGKRSLTEDPPIRPHDVSYLTEAGVAHNRVTASLAGVDRDETVLASVLPTENFRDEFVAEGRLNRMNNMTYTLTDTSGNAGGTTMRTSSLNVTFDGSGREARQYSAAVQENGTRTSNATQNDDPLVPTAHGGHNDDTSPSAAEGERQAAGAGSHSAPSFSLRHVACTCRHGDQIEITHIGDGMSIFGRIASFPVDADGVPRLRSGSPIRASDVRYFAEEGVARNAEAAARANMRLEDAVLSKVTLESGSVLASNIADLEHYFSVPSTGL